MKHISFSRILRTLTALVLALAVPFNAMAATLTLPGALKTVSAQAFMNNTSVDEVVLPDGTLSIESQAFAGCTALTRVVIPDSVTFIAEDAFEDVAVDALFIDAPEDSYAARWARDHGIATNEPEAELTVVFDHYSPTLYVGGNLEEAVAAYLTFDGALGEGETIEWNVEKVSGSDGVDFYIGEVSEDSLNAYVYARNVTAEGEAVWRATAQLSDGTSWSQEFTTTVVPLPDDMPTQFTGPDSMQCVVGQRIEVNRDELMATDGVWPEGMVSSLGLRDLWGYETFENTEDGFAFTPLEKGEYWINRRVTIGNYQIAGEFVFIVVGDGTVVFDHYFPTLYVGGNMEEIDVASIMFNGALGEGETIEWNVEKVSGSDGVNFYIGEVSEDGLTAYVIARGVNAEGEAVWRATAQLPDGTSWSQEFVTNVVPLPQDIPAELEVDYPVYAEVGERFEFKPSERIHNLHAFPDNGNRNMCHIAYYGEIWDDPTHEHIDDGANGAFAFTPSKSERYGFSLFYYIGNHVVEHHGILFIGDGTTDRDTLVKSLSDVVYLDGQEDFWIGNVMVSRYHLLPGEEVAWNIELIESSNEETVANVYISDLFEGTTGANFRVNGLTGETGTVTYLITAEAGGSVFTYEYVLTVDHLPDNLPTGISVPQTHYEVELGDTLDFLYSDISFVDGEVPEGITVQEGYWDTELIENEQEFSWRDDGGISIHFVQEGRYQITAVKVIGNVELRLPITIVVGSGMSQNARLEIWQPLYTAYAGVQEENHALNAEVVDYALFEGESYEWKLEQISEGEAPLTVYINNEYDNWRGVNLHACDYHSTGSATYRLTVISEGGLELSAEFTINVVDLPENLPTAISMEQTSYQLEVGDRLSLTYDMFDIADGEIPQGADVKKTFHDAERLPNMYWTDNGLDATFDAEGRYQIWAIVEIGNYIIRQPVVIVVGDGMDDSVQLAERMFFSQQYVNMDGVNWVGDLQLENYEPLEGEQLEWRIERIDENEFYPGDVVIDHVSDDGTWCGIHMYNFTGETGSTTWRITLESSLGYSWSRDYDIEIIEKPDTAPNEIAVPEEIVYLNPGDYYAARYSDLGFADGEVPEGADVFFEFMMSEALGEYHTMNWTEDGFEVTLYDEGRYVYTVSGTINGLELFKNVVVVVGSGVSADTALRFYQSLHTAYYGADHDVYVGDVSLEGYRLMPGEAHEWSLELISAPENNLPVEVVLGDEYDDGNGINLHATGINNGTGTVTYRLHFTTESGLALSTDFTIDVVDRPENLPTEVSVPETTYYLEAGDTFDLRYDQIGIANGEVPEGADFSTEIWLDGDGSSFEWYEHGVRATFEADGRHTLHAAVRIGNYTAAQQVVIVVGSGISADAALRIHQSLHTAYYGADHDVYVGDVSLEGYRLIPGEAHEWSLELISAPENNLPVEVVLGDEYDNGNGINLHATGINNGTGTVTYRLHFTTESGLALSTDFTIDVVDRPENLPTEVSVPETTYYLEAGDTFELRYDQFDIANGEVPEGADFSKEIWVNGDGSGFEWFEDGIRATFEADGRYTINAAVRIGNYTACQEIEIIVGSGIPQDAWVEWWGTERTIYTNQDVWVWAFDARVHNYERFEDDEFVWTLEQISEGKPVAEVEQMDDWLGVWYNFKPTGSQTGTVVYRATLNTGSGFTHSQDLTVHVVERPDDLPSDIIVPETEYNLQIGDTLVIRESDVSFADGVVPEGAWTSTGFGWMENEDLSALEGFRWLQDENGFEVTFNENGRHRFFVTCWINNILYEKEIRVNVGTGVSDDVYVDWAQEVHTIYTGLEESATWIGWGVLDHFPVYSESDTKWTFERIDGGEETPVELYIEVFDGVHADVRYTNIQGTGSVTYRLTVETSTGFTDSRDFTVNVEELPENLPTALDMQTYYQLNPGDTFVFDNTVPAFADGVVPDNASLRCHVTGDEFNHLMNMEEFEWTENGFQVTLHDEGVYGFWFGLQIGNYSVDQYVTIVVGDFGANAWVDLHMPNTTIFNVDEAFWVGDAYLNDYPLREGDHIEWSIERVDENESAPAELYIDFTFNDECAAAIRARNITGETGDMTWRVSVNTIGGFSWSQDVEIHVVDGSNKPADILVPAEDVYLNVGDTYTAMLDDVQFDGGSIEGMGVYKEFWYDSLGEYYGFESIDGGFQVTFNENGRYSYYAVAYVGGVEYVKQVRVHVGTGIADDAHMRTDIPFAVHYLNGQSQWIADAFLENYVLFGGEEIHWNIECLDENPLANLFVDPVWDDGRCAGFRMDNYTGETGVVNYRITAAISSGHVFTYEDSFQLAEMPDNMPAEISMPEEDVYLEVGQTYSARYADVFFEGGEIPEDAQYGFVFYADEIQDYHGFEWLEEGFDVTFYENGRYRFYVASSINGVDYEKEIRLHVGTGISDEAYLMPQQNAYTAYAATEGNAWIGSVSLQNYVLFDNEQIEWSIERMDGNEENPLYLYIDNVWGDQLGANIHADGFTGETGSVIYLITARTESGFEASCEFVLDVVEQPDDLPTLLHVPSDSLHFNIGDEFTLHDFDLTFSDDGVIPEDAALHYEYWDPEGVFHDQEVWWNEDNGGFTVRFHREGRYELTVAALINTYKLTRTIRVTVGDGVNDDVHLQLWHALDPVYVGGDNTWIGNAFVHSYSLFEGENVGWSIEQKNADETPAAGLVIAENEYWENTLGMNYHVQDASAVGETTYVVTANLPTGEILQQELTLHVQEMPEGLPTELIVPEESYTFNVGDTMTLRTDDIHFGEGEIPEDAAIHTDIWPDGMINEGNAFEWFVDEDGSEGVAMEFFTPGVYNICAVKWIGNYVLYKDIPVTVVDPDGWRIAILTGSEAQGAEEYTAAHMAAETYGYDHVIVDTYPDNFTSEIDTTIAKINAFAEDPGVKAIIVEQAVPGTVSGFEQVAASRDDVLLISAMPQEMISMASSASDIVLMSDEGAQAGPIMDKCEEWGIEVFVHYSFPRHLAMSEVAERRDLLKSRAEALGIEFKEVNIPDPTSDNGVEFSCNYVAENVAEQSESYAGRKVAFYSTACGVQAALQAAVLQFENAYYPSPCCPSPFHGFGESLGLGLDLSNPSGALRKVANALNEHGAAGRFSTGAAPVNMGVMEVAAQYAAAYAQGQVQDANDGEFLKDLFDAQFNGAHVSGGDYDNVYTILMPLVDFNAYVGEEAPGKIAILTGSVYQSEEEYTAAQIAMETYGEDRVIVETYPDNFIDEMDTTIEQLLAFADDPEVKAIIVAQSVPGTLEAFEQISESRDDVLLISGMPQEDIGAMSAAADVVMLTDEAAHAAPIMNKCEEWGIDVFVHYAFPRHLAIAGVANRLAGIKAAAETLGIQVVEVEMPDPVEDGLETARSFILDNVPEQLAAYADQKVAFFATNCGVQASLQTAVLQQANAYYPQPCCPSPFHGFGESLELNLDLRNPTGALRAIANKLNETGAAGRFSTWPVPVNMGIIDVAAEFAMAYANGDVEGNDAAIIADMFNNRCGTDISVSESGNVYTILLSPVNFPDHVVDDNTTITLWVAEGVREFTQRQVDTFMAANEQYADLKVMIESVGEGDAADRVLASDEEAVDMFVFAQDQLARLVIAERLVAVPDENAAVIAQENDSGSVEAVQVGGVTYAYPMTSDNGYFLYYDSSVVTDPSSLESIIASCEAAGKGVLMELTSGWYQPAFFFGAGCTLTYDIDSEGNFVSCNVDYASENGVRALKAMIALAGSESFENKSDTNSDLDIGAVVSGTWIAQPMQELLGDNYAAVKLPTADGFQMSGFGGFKMLGVRPQPNEHKQAACEDLAMYLTSEEVQTARYNEAAWGPSNLQAQQSDAVQNDAALAALADQLQYCVPQGQYPGEYWSLAEQFGARLLAGEFDGMTDEELMGVLAQFQQDAIAIVTGNQVTRLRWAMGTAMGAPADNAMVLEELNAMSRELIGVECDIEYYTQDQLQNAIAAGEEFDMYFTCSWFNNTNSLISQGRLLDVSDAVRSVTPGMYASMSEEVWDLASTGSALYAIPVKKDYAAMQFITYPSDMADELGFEIPAKISAWSELTPFLEAWKETLPENEYPVLIGGAARGIESSFDFIDRTALIGCEYGSTNVVTVFDDPEIMERYRALADWYSKGLINPDAPNITEADVDTSKPSIRMVQAWPGYDYSGSNGYNTAMTSYTNPMLSRDGVQGAMNALSSHLADDPERRDACLKYLELCYTNQLFNDTMRYGVQGYHWNYVTEAQNPELAGAVLRTQAGASNYAPWGFSQPSYFTASIAVSQDQVNGSAKAPNLNQYNLYYEAIEADGVASALDSFYWDSSAWTNQLAEMIDIKDQYYCEFATGARSIDEVYDEFMAKMNAAGLQEMIADAQAQLDAYLGR